MKRFIAIIAMLMILMAVPASAHDLSLTYHGHSCDSWVHGPVYDYTTKDWVGNNLYWYHSVAIELDKIEKWYDYRVIVKHWLRQGTPSNPVFKYQHAHYRACEY